MIENQDSQSIVTQVFPANIAAIWPQIYDLLKPAVDRCGTHLIEDVRKRLLIGSAQLWVKWTDHAEWAMVTDFQDYPQGLWLRVWLAGAVAGIKTNWEEAETAAVDFALANKCVGIENVGRDGWAKRHESASNVAKGIRIFRHRFGG